MSDDTIPIYQLYGMNTDWSNRKPAVADLNNLVADVSQRFDDIAPHLGVVAEIQSPHLIPRVQRISERSFAGLHSKLRCKGRAAYDRLGVLYDNERFEEMRFEVNVPFDLIDKLKDAKCLPVPLRDNETGHEILFVGCHLPYREAKKKKFCCELMRDTIEELLGSFHYIIVCGDLNMRRRRITSSLGVSEDMVAFMGIDNVIVYNSDVVKYWGHETIRASDYYTHHPIAVRFACER